MKQVPNINALRARVERTIAQRENAWARVLSAEEHHERTKRAADAARAQLNAAVELAWRAKP